LGFVCIFHSNCAECGDCQEGGIRMESKSKPLITLCFWGLAEKSLGW